MTDTHSKLDETGHAKACCRSQSQEESSCSKGDCCSKGQCSSKGGCSSNTENSYAKQHTVENGMTFTLRVWRQQSQNAEGAFENYKVSDIASDMSFLEMLDILNQDLVKQKKMPIAFAHDCREGICGACSMVINGSPQGPLKATTACQLRMRHFKNGDSITIEPFRAKAFPVVRDLVVDRSAFDRIIGAGGYISANVGSAPEPNAIPIHQERADLSLDAAACIGCGACAAACQNGSAMLFVSAKVSHLGLLPQGEVEQEERVVRMVRQMEEEDFGSCTNLGTCASACPKSISLENIARLNRGFMKALVFGKKKYSEY